MSRTLPRSGNIKIIFLPEDAWSLLPKETKDFFGLALGAIMTVSISILFMIESTGTNLCGNVDEVGVEQWRES